MPSSELVQTVVSLSTGEPAGVPRLDQNRLRRLAGLSPDRAPFSLPAASRGEVVTCEVYESRSYERLIADPLCELAIIAGKRSETIP